ncbi:MAG: ribosome silencing factor [Lachnospiraceae bacterium]|nr:ribosome silencing factor [Lachnospiraceae bacterium]
MDCKKLISIALKAIDDKKGKDVVVLDIKDISILADYFIIASCMNKNQTEAMVEEIIEKLHKEEINIRAMEGRSDSGWILMDYQDVIIHIFDEESRSFYDLERIWGDSKRVERSAFS